MIHVTPQKFVTGVQTKPAGPRRPPRGFSLRRAAPTSFMSLDAARLPRKKQKNKLKQGPDKEKECKTCTCDKLRHPLNWLSDPAAAHVVIYPSLIFSLCFFPGKSLAVVSWKRPRGN